VREGHARLVRFLLDLGGVDPSYRSYPFQDSLLTIAEDRGHSAVSAVLREHLSRRFSLKDGLTTILDAAQKGDLAGVRQELERDPSLAQAATTSA
jgi:hypothetical protein